MTCERAPDVTFCACRNDISGWVSNCLNCAVNKTDDHSFNESKAQQMMDGYISGCKNLGAELESHQITGNFPNSAPVNRLSVGGLGFVVLAAVMSLL
ncbi:hypothetical protein VKT23_006378 [Stygiomarasmius scandens]|uniref:Uncharacterized protein n=1 Tax=Marasmiellus scandens TaxID=2682957 RepID=A0ABR1JNZ0_9AGAR